MARYFCTAGPLHEEIQYSVPPLARDGASTALELVDSAQYFSVQAPLHSGKTSFLHALEKRLNGTGRYRAVYVDAEPARAAGTDYVEGIRIILGALAWRAERVLRDSFVSETWRTAFAREQAEAFTSVLTDWCAADSRPVCLLIDDYDKPSDEVLNGLLRQLRTGFVDRYSMFPRSVVLCGTTAVGENRVSGFNIRSTSLFLKCFTPEEIRGLYEQHTAETGQRFDERIYPLIWEFTRGQPWLVNTLADVACFRLEKNRSRTITPELISAAKGTLVQTRTTHLFGLPYKLLDPRTRSVIEPMLQGEDCIEFGSAHADSGQYATDLGLAVPGPAGLEIANGIYKEVIPRELNFRMQEALAPHVETAWYVAADGRLDMAKLLAALQQFFRENSEVWLERYEYREAGPQLLLQAFLQRVVNGGGRIDREYALGRRRTDLLVTWNHPGGVQRAVIEVKVLRGGIEKTIRDGVAQTAEYVDRTGAEEAHLVIFDRDPAKQWDKKVWRREESSAAGGRITVWAM